MPTPLGHAIAGLAVYAAGSKSETIFPAKKEYGLIAVCVLASWAPDLDFIHWSENGLTITGLYHHGITHSIGFAIMIASITSAAAYAIKSPFYLKTGALAGASYGLHILLDLLGHDTYAENGIGLPALWPITGEYFVFSILPPTNRLDPFGAETIFGVAVEVVVTGAFLAGAIFLQKVGKRRSKA